MLIIFVLLIGLCNNSDLRLVGGSNEREGRIEICFNETWGTVCDNFWSTNDASVACRQLGFSEEGKLHVVNTSGMRKSLIVQVLYLSS